MPLPFANPWMLAALAAVALPLLIHWLARRKNEVVPWGAMQFLESEREGRSRLPRAEWLLLAARMALVALLVLAFAGPWLPADLTGGIGPRAPRDLALVIDGSASMSSTDGERTPHAAAVEAANRLIDGLFPGDTVTLIDAREEPRLIAEPLGRDFGRVRRALQDLVPPAGSAQLAGGVARAVGLLQSGRHLRREVVVLTDGTMAGWSVDDPAAWRAMEQPRGNEGVSTRVVAVDFSSPGSNAGKQPSRINRAVDPLSVSRTKSVVGLPVTVRTAIRGWGERAPHPETVQFEVDGETIADRTADVTVVPDGAAAVEFVHRFDAAGLHTVGVSLNEDSCPADDRAVREIEVSPPVSVLLIDGDPQPDGTGGDAFYLRQALAAPWFLPRVAGWNDWPTEDLEQPAVVVLANVPRVSEEQGAWLERHVSAGGGLCIAPGDQVDAELYNRILYRDGEGVLPARLQQVHRAARPARLSEIEAPFAWSDDAGRGVGARVDLREALFDAWWRIEEPKWPAARLEGGDPWLVAGRQGAGRVLLVAGPLDAAWSTLPACRGFVPLMHEAMLWLALTPGKSGDRADDTMQHSTQHSTRNRLVAEASHDESSLARLTDVDRDRLSQASGIEFVSGGEAAAQAVLERSAPRAFWRVLLLAAGILLAAEWLLARRMERADPDNEADFAPTAQRRPTSALHEPARS